MKTIIILATFAAASLALASCGKDKSGDADKDASASAGEYPLTTCVVSGEKLGSMGEPIVREHNGTTVKFCCDSCLPDFEKDPEKYIAKLKK